MSKLSDIMARTHMTREQIKRAVATGAGRFPPDTYARLPAEADKRLAELYQAMRETRQYLAPEIATAEQAGELRRLIQAHAPVDTGALRDSFDDPRTVMIMPDGRVEIDSALPYARIQDLGGTIHRVSSTGKAYTIRIPSQHYVGKAILEYNARHANDPAPALKEGEIASGYGIAELVSRGFALMASYKGAA